MRLWSKNEGKNPKETKQHLIFQKPEWNLGFNMFMNVYKFTGSEWTDVELWPLWKVWTASGLNW